MDHWINLLPILILTAACFYIMLTDEWFLLMAGYAVIYLAGFSIMVQYWSLTFSLIKLLTGLMSLVVLGLSVYKNREKRATPVKSAVVFRCVALGLFFIILTFLVYRISNYLSVPLEIVLASLLILTMSVFQLGITQDHLKLFLAIISLFFGFEMIFSANETSLLINGLLAVLTLLISLMGSYMIVNETEEDKE
jgi:hypothetical protein